MHACTCTHMLIHFIIITNLGWGVILILEFKVHLLLMKLKLGEVTFQEYGWYMELVGFDPQSALSTTLFTVLILQLTNKENMVIYFPFSTKNKLSS